VLTFNTHIGRRLDEVRRIVREWEPHLVVLQELWIHRHRDWEWNQAATLAGDMQMEYAYHRYTWKGKSQIGLALFATGRITEVAEIDGPGIRSPGLSARVEIAGRWVGVAAVHLAAVPRPLVVGYPCIMATHYRQMARTIRRLKDMGGPVILAGDFNTIPGTPAHRLACRYLIDVARRVGACDGTRRTWGLPLRIDYIFASSHFRCEECRVLDAEGSDHRPLFARLRWNDE